MTYSRKVIVWTDATAAPWEFPRVAYWAVDVDTKEVDARSRVLYSQGRRQNPNTVIAELSAVNFAMTASRIIQTAANVEFKLDCTSAVEILNGHRMERQEDNTKQLTTSVWSSEVMNLYQRILRKKEVYLRNSSVTYQLVPREQNLADIILRRH